MANRNKDKTDSYRALLFHEDNLFANRVNLFLVAESMLFISYVTSLGNEYVSTIIGILGIFLTLSIGFINIRASENINILKNEMDKGILGGLNKRGRMVIPTPSQQGRGSYQ